MGDAAVSLLLRDAVGRLTSEAAQRIYLFRGLKDDILSLKEAFELVQAVLQDAEEKRTRNKAVELWLKDLRSESMKILNVLDELSTEAIIQRLHKQRGIKYRVRAFFSSNHNKCKFRVRIAQKIKVIRRTLDDVASKRYGLGLRPLNVSIIRDMGAEAEMTRRETYSIGPDSSSIFGKDEELEMVTKKICNKDIGKHDDGEIKVYGIWGMGGLGKTTLAQLVYNHETVMEHFDLRCWVYVSENFQVKEIIKKIIEFVDHDECTLTDLGRLQVSLESKLRERRFIIVLDDVWIEDDEKAKWDGLSKALSCGAEGSIVMMTTRSRATCEMMAKVPELQHKLGFLSEEDAWLLFKKHAFAQGGDGDHISELEPIGREIVEKCKGLPFAVKILGSLMCSESRLRNWQYVKHNIWELEEIKPLFYVLKRSYDNLLPHFKRCFAYCCLFPIGYSMQKDVVVQLWVSNYFIPPKGEKSAYMLGEEIFNDLVSRFYFEVVKDNKYSDDRYKMHDLMHHMARYVMKNDCLFIEPLGNEVRISNEVLHLSSSSPDFLFSPRELLKSLWSIFIFGKINEGDISQIFNHKYVRVLHLCDFGLTTLSESISNLKHLKYLNLSNSKIEVLPESIIYLQNLQVLLLYSCGELHKLPDDLGYMNSLECLDLRYCHSLSHLPIGIKKLTCLRVLSKFLVGNNKRGAKIEELGDLNLLEGKLKIAGLENVGGLSEARTAELKLKTNLSVLGLRWSDIYKRESKPEMFANDEEVLQGLEPNSGLMKLNIFCYMGKSLPQNWMDKLKNLREIRFYSCRRCVHIQSLGRLPYLTSIRLWSMDSLESFHGDDKFLLGDTTNMFCCLEELRIYLCPNLVSLPSNLPSIRLLRLVKCNKLRSLPDNFQSFKNMDKLVILSCKLLNETFEEKNHEDWAKISHIPNIRTRSPWITDDHEMADDHEMTLHHDEGVVHHDGVAIDPLLQVDGPFDKDLSPQGQESPQAHGAPQYPQHVYPDVPHVIISAIQRIERDLHDLHRRHDRTDDWMMWMVESEAERRRLMGMPPRPPPPPRHYLDDEDDE